MDTDLIPKDVDLGIAAERTVIIERFRMGEVGAEDTLLDLLGLYWRTQTETNGATSVYLMEASYQFPVEAGMSAADAIVIWQLAQEEFS